MLAADIDVTGFDTDDSDVVVHYDISGATVSAFDIAIYTTTDGSTPETLLKLHRVSTAADRAVGTDHTATIGLDFTDSQSDYQLLAIADASEEVTETSETNNEMLFEGGVFQTQDGTVHVHGTASSDTVNLTKSSDIGVTLNSHTANFTTSSVSAVHIRTHGAGDTLTAASGLGKNILAIGGAGNDTLNGSDSSDVLHGGTGDDSLHGGYGDDVLEGGEGDDLIYGENGDDSVYGGNGDDVAFGGLGADFLDGGSGTNTLDAGGDTGDRTKPEIRQFTAEKLPGGTWKLSGCVVDDTDPESGTVEFSGVIADSTTVDSYGCFELIVDAPPESGLVSAEFEDEHGLTNYEIFVYIAV